MERVEHGKCPECGQVNVSSSQTLVLVCAFVVTKSGS